MSSALLYKPSENFHRSARVLNLYEDVVPQEGREGVDAHTRLGESGRHGDKVADDGEAGQKVFGKAMDDRFTYPVMLGIAEKIQGKKLSCDLYLASTVLEEVGLRGVQFLSKHGFDIGIALDIGIAGDYPALPKGRMPIKLGGGPVLVWRDAGIVYYIDTIKELMETAERHNLPYQHGIFEHYGSDGVSMVLGGAKPNLVATLCRYSHMPIETMHLDDINRTVELLYNYVTD